MTSRYGNNSFNVFGHRNQIQVGSHGSLQIQSTIGGLEDVHRQVISLREALETMGFTLADDALTVIQHESRADMPNLHRFKEALRSLRAIAEGAAGSVAGQLLSQFLASLGS